jgi:HAE1 family hydrophobic/amphiphilic exporter-1
MREALGVAVFFGMIGVTLFGLLFTPAFYVIARNLGDWVSTRVRRGRTAPAIGKTA